MKRLLLTLWLCLPALAQFNNTITTDSVGVLQLPTFFQVNQGTLGLSAILRTNGTAIGTHDFEDITADQITAGALFDSTPFTGGEAENRLAQVGYVKQLAPAIGEDVADLLALPVYAISRWAYLTTDEKFWVFCPDDLTADNGTTIRRPTSVASDSSPGRWVQITLAGGGGGGGTVTSVTLTQPAAGLTITSSGTAITTSGTRTFALANDLAALEGLSGTGYPKRTGTDTWSVSGTVPWSDVASTPTTLSGYGITDAQPLDADLTDLADGSLTGSKVGTGIDAGNITTGTVGTARLGSGTANSTTYLRGDNTWGTPAGSGVATIVGNNGIGVSGTTTITLSLGGITPTGVTSSGNITGNNLSGVNTGDETGATVLSKLLTVDGAGSGIDADLLDGQSSAYYRDAANMNAGTLPDARLSSAVVTTTGTQTLTNKRNTPRVASISYAASITPDSDAAEVVNVGTLTGAITINAPSGTPTDGQLLTFRFVQDGTGRAITWNSAFAFGTDITSALIPSTANAKFEVGVRWDSTDSKWRVVALVRGF